MAVIRDLTRYRLQKARQQMPLAIYYRDEQTIREYDNRINQALGMVLADPAIPKSLKIKELKLTLRLYRRIAENLENCML
ncbi:hypothetical protein [Halioxenophilus sp. WMMB6]|uniref:hypothetical protein n=1 Tax=Halioxenophilus sp. WMMB6 TaxID=3073815 RepID=UPI00295F22B4|nr:hypothetical protein [Halioxenophilus sp. WMMB6]